jgi:hypothetical protein
MSIPGILADKGLRVAQKEERIAEFLSAQPDFGVAHASDVLLRTDSEIVAHYVAGYLARVPHVLEDKRRVLSHLVTSSDELAKAAASLIAYATTEQLAPIVARFRRAPSESHPIYALMYEIALYFPEFLRRDWDALNFPSLRRGMLSGAADAWVDAQRAAYATRREPEQLELLGCFHTAKATQALLDIQALVPHEQRALWECCIEQAGTLSDGTTPSHVKPTYRGVVAPRGETPHAMGGSWAGLVPACPACSAPVARILSLQLSALPFRLSGRDPTFFWYSCECNTCDVASARITEGGVDVLGGPAARASSADLIPGGERSLQLDEHPNQSGMSLAATGRSGVHQVGGIPRWYTPRPLRSCPSCQKKMPVLATIDNGMCMFGRLRWSGILYGFYCADCSITVTERQ